MVYVTTLTITHKRSTGSKVQVDVLASSWI